MIKQGKKQKKKKKIIKRKQDGIHNGSYKNSTMFPSKWGYAGK